MTQDKPYGPPVETEPFSLQFELSGATEQYRTRLLDDWRWSEGLVNRPLPLCLVVGI
jgi:hypothetical protein